MAELRRRGIGHKELVEMVVFAWQMAGRLNYHKMLWDWVGLYESDIELALDRQVREGLIPEDARREALQYLSKFGSEGVQGKT